MKKSPILISLCFTILFSSEIITSNESPNYISSNIKQTIPQDLDSSYKKYFNRYAKITASNGKHIYILAQKTISNEQILRVKNVLSHYLKNYEGSVYGSNKKELINQMANNQARILLLDGEDNGENPAGELEGQPLYKNEIQVEGGKWYISQDYEHRDATFEEILHLVHDKGIGVDGANSYSGVLKNFQKEIRVAQVYALKNKIWGIGNENKNWINELRDENSLSQEYLASLIDAYYGLWGAWEGNSSMWGIYSPKDREDIIKKDILGNKILNNKFFHSYLTYNARIDASFKGTFFLEFNKSILYTSHSRYLKDITLLGKNNTKVKVNELDNYITGNKGINTVIFSGKYNEYIIREKNEIIIVEDKILNRNGKKNRLKNIEIIQFLDKSINLNKR